MSISEVKESEAPWYLLQVQSNYEDRVADTIREGVALHGLDNKIHNVLVPKEEVKSVKDGRTVKTAQRLYPGYVMVQVEFDDNVWHFLKKTKNVRGFIGGSRPSAMKPSEVKQIFSLMKSSEAAPKPKVEYTIGQTVRITNGPFTDFQGNIEQVDYNRSRLKVVVMIFGRATPVELTFSDIAVE